MADEWLTQMLCVNCGRVYVPSRFCYSGLCHTCTGLQLQAHLGVPAANEENMTDVQREELHGED